jgi:lipoprotein-anchoring transpeptidase ErfK/SrfK
MKYSLIIDPNTNIILNTKNNKKYKMFSGDYKKSNRKKHYYTPSGVCQIIQKRKDNTLMYYPLFIRLSFYRLPCVYDEQVSEMPYAIHGYGKQPHRKRVLEQAKKYSGYISRGCIELNDNDLVDLYNTINVGDSVYVLPYNDIKIQEYMKKYSRYRIIKR